MSAALNEATESSFEVRAEDSFVQVMLVHHRANHPVFLTTAKDTSYDVGKIRECNPNPNPNPERYRHTLYSYIASLTVIPYQQFLGLTNHLCSASSARLTNQSGPWMCSVSSEPRKWHHQCWLWGTFRCCCKKQGVKCIYSCGICHGNRTSTSQMIIVVR